MRAEIVVPANAGAIIIDQSDIPRTPKKRTSLFETAVPKFIRPAVLRRPGEVIIDKNDDRFRIEINCGGLQPGRRVWSDVFCVGKAESGNLSFTGQVFAENLPQPKTFALGVSVNVKRTRMDVSDLRSLPEPVVEEE